MVTAMSTALSGVLVLPRERFLRDRTSQEPAERFPSVAAWNVDLEEIFRSLCKVRAHTVMVLASFADPHLDVDREPTAVVGPRRCLLLIRLHMPATAVEPIVKIPRRQYELTVRILRVEQFEVLRDRTDVGERIDVVVDWAECRPTGIDGLLDGVGGGVASPMQRSVTQVPQRGVEGRRARLVQTDAEDPWTMVTADGSSLRVVRGG